jgi:hypothetical protein
VSAEHTPGPWAWFGNATTNSLYLATTHSGRRFVMDFTRWGFRGAQPRFQAERGIMIDAKDLLQFEVGDQSVVGVEAAKKDTSVYRLDVRSIKSGDARLIASAPDLLEALRALLDSDVDKDWAHEKAEAALDKAEGRSAPVRKVESK